MRSAKEHFRRVGRVRSCIGTLVRGLHGYGSKGQQCKPGGAAAEAALPSSPDRMPLTAGARESRR
jgi:hypothetical protein